MTNDQTTSQVNGDEILGIARDCSLVLPPQSTAIVEPVQPKNGKSFKLAELYALLDCQTIQVVDLPGTGMIFITDEEGKFREPLQLNELATAIWYKYVPEAQGVDFLTGKVMLCRNELLK